jgi:hypothetical protein
LHDVTIAKTSSVTKEDWEGYCHHGRTTEEAYCKKDSIIYDINIRFIISNPNAEALSGDTVEEITQRYTCRFLRL